MDLERVLYTCKWREDEGERCVSLSYYLGTYRLNINIERDQIRALFESHFVIRVNLMGYKSNAILGCEMGDCATIIIDL